MFCHALLRQGSEIRFQFYRRFVPPQFNQMFESSKLVTHFTSESFDFITHLSIRRSGSFTKAQYRALTGMVNLGVLEIALPECRSRSRLDDSVFESWVRQPGAFPVLRVLRLNECSFVSTKSLKILTRLPSLVVFQSASMRNFDPLGDCGHIENLGWKYAPAACSSSARPGTSLI